MSNEEKYMKAIADNNKRINSMEQKLDHYFAMLHEKNAADIEYLAMMADVELNSDNEEEVINNE
jgi:hypothetical protein